MVALKFFLALIGLSLTAAESDTLLQSRTVTSVSDVHGFLIEEEPSDHARVYRVRKAVPACVADDIVCQTGQLEGSFADHDSDGNGCITASEIHATTLDEAVFQNAIDTEQNVSGDEHELLCSTTAAKILVHTYDLNDDGCLDSAEWVSTAAGIPVDNSRAGAPSNLKELKHPELKKHLSLLSKEHIPIPIVGDIPIVGEIAEQCVDDVIDTVAEKLTFECVTTMLEERCWKSLKFWESSFWTCKWHSVQTLGTCLYDQVVDAIAAVAETLQQCWQNVITRVTALVRLFLPTSCTSLATCQQVLLDAGTEVMDTIMGYLRAVLGGIGSGAEIADGDPVEGGEYMIRNLDLSQFPEDTVLGAAVRILKAEVGVLPPPAAEWSGWGSKNFNGKEKAEQVCSDGLAEINFKQQSNYGLVDAKVVCNSGGFYTATGNRNGKWYNSKNCSNGFSELRVHYQSNYGLVNAELSCPPEGKHPGRELFNDNFNGGWGPWMGCNHGKINGIQVREQSSYGLVNLKVHCIPYTEDEIKQRQEEAQAMRRL